MQILIIFIHTLEYPPSSGGRCSHSTCNIRFLNTNAIYFCLHKRDKFNHPRGVDYDMTNLCYELYVYNKIYMYNKAFLLGTNYDLIIH